MSMQKVLCWSYAEFVFSVLVRCFGSSLETWSPQSVEFCSPSRAAEKKQWTHALADSTEARL